MFNFIQRATRTTPFTRSDFEKAEIEIKGISCPVDPFVGYAFIGKWIEEYARNPRVKTIIVFDIDYFNIDSLLYFLKMLKHFENLSCSCELVIHWIFDNDDISVSEYEKIISKVIYKIATKKQIFICAKYA